MMRTTVFAALSGLLLTLAINHPAAAHPMHAKHSPPSRDFMAISPDRNDVYAPRADGALHGPTYDSQSSATGGPSGGIY